jgi:hypothetical protein
MPVRLLLIPLQKLVPQPETLVFSTTPQLENAMRPVEIATTATTTLTLVKRSSAARENSILWKSVKQALVEKLDLIVIPRPNNA